jgi:hypothetical protein
MTQIDLDRERARLTDLYARMADEELDKLLQSSDELTETAREVLKAEIEKRGGHVEYSIIPSAAEAAHPQLVTVARFRDLPEAMLARGRLQSAGIDAFLADENYIRMDWFMSNMIGNMRLQVREEDVESAKEILQEQVPEDFEIGADGEKFEQPRCPKCGSVDIEFEGVNRGLGLVSAYAIGIPLSLRRDLWKCNHCGAEWRENDDPKNQPVDANQEPSDS